MTTINPNFPSHASLHANKVPGFFFRKRVERIDWKRLASVDVCRVVSQMDIDALQENLVSVAFCDITSELDTRYVDTNLIKLFQLAQLLIEYLLYSQDYLTNTVDSLKLENQTIKKEAEALKKRLDQQMQRLTTTRKECHRRRLLLLAQQRLMNNGPQSYHRCPHCPKAFINASFLSAHLFRRHPDVVSALHDIELARSNFFSTNSGNHCQAEKVVNVKQPALTTNLEEQIREVLDHLKSQVPTLSPPQTSAMVQTVEVKGEATSRTTGEDGATSEVVWRRRTAELERQLEEERERIRQLEERNRAWQDSITSQHRVRHYSRLSRRCSLASGMKSSDRPPSQHRSLYLTSKNIHLSVILDNSFKTDIERVRDLFEVELRNLRAENLETQKELIQLRVKRADVSTFGDIEDDVPKQLERQVRSLESPSCFEKIEPSRVKMTKGTASERSPKPVSTPSSSSNLPIIEMVNNANNTAQSMCYSSSLNSQRISISDGATSPMRNLDVLHAVCATHSGRRKRKQKKIFRCANAAVQAMLHESTQQHLTSEVFGVRDQQAFRKNSGLVVEGLIVKTEDEEDGEMDKSRSIHLIPFVVPSSGIPPPAVQETSVKKGKYHRSSESGCDDNKIVQLVDDGSYTSDYVKERLRASHLSTKPKGKGSERPQGPSRARSDELRVNPLESIPHFKDQIVEFRSNSDAMKRLREEMEVLLSEQLMDHNVNANAKGLTKGKFNETLDILGQERQQLARKHPNFTEIRATIARKVDHMALIAIHSKRERHNSSPLRGSDGGSSGGGDGAGCQKKPRASRTTERIMSGRPPSGRPASLTSLTPLLSPIAEHRRFATASPNLRKTNPTQSKQSLFENTEYEEDADSGGEGVRRADDRTAVHKGTKKPFDSLRDRDDRTPNKLSLSGPSVKFSDLNRTDENNNADEDDEDFEDDAADLVSVSSILAEDQRISDLSPLRRKVREARVVDPVVESGTVSSLPRPRASYNISTSQWETSSQVDDNQRFDREEPEEYLESGE